MPVRLLYSVGSVPFGYPRCLRRPTALDILCYPMQVRSISRRLVSWVMGISSVSVSVSVSVTVASSRSCVDRWTRFPRATVSCLRFLVSRLWPAVFHVLVINRVVLVCSGTLFFWQHVPLIDICILIQGLARNIYFRVKIFFTQIDLQFTQIVVLCRSH